MKITYITWKDACTQEAAEPHAPVMPALIELREVGFLVGESDEAVTIAMELDGALPGRWRLHIPKVNIVSRVDVEIAAAFPVGKAKRRAKS